MRKRTFGGSVKTWLVILLPLLVLALAGCGGGGSSAIGGGGGGNGEAVIPATTKVLSDTTVAAISGISPDKATITFSASTPDIAGLQSGDHLVLGVTPATPDGLLRKITGVQQNPDGSVTLQTEAAALEEVVQSGSVSATVPLSLDNLAAPPELAEGVTLEPAAAAKTAKAVNLEGSTGMTLKLKDVVLYDHDGDKNTKGDRVTVNGEISLKTSMKMDIDIADHTLKTFTFSAGIDQKSSLYLAAGAYVDFDTDKTKIKLNKAPIVFSNTTIWIGYVPVVVTCALDFYVGADGEISIGTSTQVTQSLGYTGGLRYANKQWSPINEPHAEYGFQPPTVDAAAEIRCYLQPELSAKLYGLAGPAINLQAYALLQVAPLETPWWKLYAGFQANAKADITLLGKQIAEYEKVILDIRTLLAQAETTRPEGSPPSVLHTLSGRITYNGSGLGGVVVDLGNGRTAVTDASGNYTFSGLGSGVYTATPTLNGYAFTPSASIVSTNGTNMTAHFTGSTTGNISIGW